MKTQLLFERMVFPPGEVKAFKEIKKVPLIKRLISIMGSGEVLEPTEALMKQLQALLSKQFLGCLTIVRAAIEYDDLGIVELFLKAGLPVDTRLLVVKKDKEQERWFEMTPLMFAINLEHTPLAHLFLKYGARADILSEQKKHALAYAAQKGNIDIAQAILERYSLQNLEQIGISPLITATAVSNVKSIAMVKYLLAQGATVNINYVSADDSTILYNPLTVAIAKNNCELVELFLQNHALFDSRVIHEAMAEAIANNYYLVVETLLSHSRGYRFEYSDKFHPYYHLPKEQTHKNNFIQLLYSHKIITTSDLKFLNCRMRIVNGLEAKDVCDIVNELTSDRSIIEHEHFDGLRYYLCYLLIKKSSLIEIKGGTELFILLLHKQGKTVVPNYPGKPCLLHTAIYYEHFKLFNILLKHGADLNQADYFYEKQSAFIPIQIAPLGTNEDNAIELVRLLIAHGVDINDCSPSSGETVLFNAVYKQKNKLIHYLLAHGANIHLKNSQGQTIVSRAIELKLPFPLIKLLLTHTPLAIETVYNEIHLAAVCQYTQVVSFFINAYVQQSDATLCFNADQQLMNSVLCLIKIGFSIPELGLLLRQASTPHVKASVRFESFLVGLARFLIEQKNRLFASPPVLVCVMLLCGSIYTLKEDGDNKCRRLINYLSAFDFSKVFSIAPQSNSHLTLIIEQLLSLYTAQLMLACNQLLSEKKPSYSNLEWQQRLLDAIILLNKHYLLQQNILTICSLNPLLLSTADFNSLLYLLHEKRLKLKEQFEREEREKNQDIQAQEINSDVLQQERERLLQQEVIRLRQKEQINNAKREEQSQRDKQKHSECHYVAVSPKKRIRYCSVPKATELKPVRIVTLTEPVQQAFSLLDVVQGEHYLTGSTVINLLFPERASFERKKADLDMVVIQEGKLDKNKMKKAGFYRSNHIQGLHTLKRPQIEVDLMIKSTKKKKKKKTDFHICQLLCDSKGTIYDPTGKGISHLEQWVLSTVYDSYSCLKDDPVRILRAMKYILRGYNPDEQLIIALFSEYPKDIIDAHREHLNASMRYYLYSDNARDMVTLLLHYKLLYPLFGVETRANLDDVIVNLWTVVQEKRPNDLIAASNSSSASCR